MDVLKAAFLLLFMSSAAFATAIPMGDLTKLDGSSFQTDKSKVVLYFWATWCPECQEKLTREFPAMNFPSDVQLVTVNTDKEAGRVQHMLDKEKIALTVVRDPKKSLMSELRVFSVPFWAVLKKQADGSWNLVDSESGGNMDKMKAALAKGD